MRSFEKTLPSGSVGLLMLHYEQQQPITEKGVDPIQQEQQERACSGASFLRQGLIREA